MILVYCKSPVDAFDLNPRLRMLAGKTYPVPLRKFNRSKVIQAAMRSGDICLADKRKAPSATKAPGRLPAPPRRIVRAQTPSEGPDMSQALDAIGSLRGDLHNLFMDMTKQFGTTPVPIPDGPTQELLGQLKDSVEGFSGRLDKLETAISGIPRTVVVTEGARAAPGNGVVDNTPTFIPSDIRTGDIKNVKLDVEITQEDAGLEDAEAALRAISGKPAKPKKTKAKTSRAKTTRKTKTP